MADLPTTLVDCPLAVIEAFCLQEALRRLGFNPNDIYTAHTEARVLVILRTQGKEVVMEVEPHSSWDDEKFYASFSHFAWLWNTAPESELTRLWADSIVRQNAVQLLKFLTVDAGFHLPTAASARPTVDC